jgi:predicted RNase H-like HicB family nuclease
MRRTTKSGSTSPRATTTEQALDRPFEDRHWGDAARLVEGYRLILEPDDEGGYIGSAVELQSVLARGATAQECIESTKRALTVAAATMLEAGQRPPAPASQKKRQIQINVRLSADEKLLLEEAARRCGFKGVSDFVRTAALERATAA